MIHKLGPKMWKGSAPTTLKDLERATHKRSFAVSKLVLDLSRFPSMSYDDTKGFQFRVLEQIALYVRDLRGDVLGSKIFANLLIPRGEDLVVISRSDRRPLGGRIPRGTSVAGIAVATGDKCFCGDLYADYPDSIPGKKYCSVLAIPLIDFDGNVVGVVTIDSREKHHFDSIHEDILLLVMPLISMLAWSVGRTESVERFRKEEP